MLQRNQQLARPVQVERRQSADAVRHYIHVYLYVSFYSKLCS
jgi:hypothetical protein